MPDIRELGKAVKAKFPGAYDDVDDGILGAKIRGKYPDAYKEFTHMPEEQPEQGWADAALGAAKGVIVNTVRNAAQMGARMLEQPKTAGDLAMKLAGPAGPLLKDMAEAQLGQFTRAADAAKEGQYTQAAGEAVAGLIPMVGPAVAEASGRMGEAAGQGDLYRAGEAVGDLAGMAVLPEAGRLGVKVAKAVRPAIPVPSFKPKTQALADAVAFADDRGIPLDAATRSGSSAIQSIQKVADSTPGGLMVQQKAKAKQQAELRRVAEELKDEVFPNPITGYDAAKEFRASLEKGASDFGDVAAEAYSGLRDFESMPANKRPVTVREKTIPGAMTLDGYDPPRRVPEVENIAFPVDVAPLKRIAKPILDELEQRYASADPDAARNMNQQAKMLKSVMEGPNYKPASIAEKDIGALKSYLRNQPEATEARMRHAEVLDELQARVDDAVSQGGPEAIAALRRGRENWAKKMEFVDFIETLRDEPVQTFGHAVWRNDSGVEWLKKAKQLSPESMPKVARAWLEDTMSRGAAEGGLTSEATMFREWDNLGPKTKLILFGDPLMVRNLDHFFTIAKEAAKTPNPSGSGLVATTSGSVAYAVTDPMTGVPMLIGAGALSRLLHNPKAVAMLSRGMDPKYGKGMGAAAAAANILKVAGDQAKPRKEEETKR